MMRRVIARRHGINVVQLRPVKAPVPNEFLGQLFEVTLHLRHRRTQRAQIANHPRVLAILVKNQPIRMLLHNLGHLVFVRLVLPLPVLDPERQPPKLGIDSLLMEVI